MAQYGNCVAITSYEGEDNNFFMTENGEKIKSLLETNVNDVMKSLKKTGQVEYGYTKLSEFEKEVWLSDYDETNPPSGYAYWKLTVN